jgi:hypothetical protein
LKEKKKTNKQIKDTVPSGSGFLIMKEILGSPPVFVFLGHHADIDSSSTIHIDG